MTYGLHFLQKCSRKGAKTQSFVSEGIDGLGVFGLAEFLGNQLEAVSTGAFGCLFF